jgi:phosphohistidine phosphatase
MLGACRPKPAQLHGDLVKTLLLMRHAKSDWDADYERDHDRPLNERGVRSARIMGRLLARQQLIPDLVITSSAQRAHATARIGSEAGAWGIDPVVEPALYTAGPGDVLDVAGHAPEVSRLMLVGHQPTWSMVVRTLTGESVEMKTATIAVVELAIDDWDDVGPRTGTVAAVLQPREHLNTDLDH